MNVSLTPELEKFVQEKVASGLYTSASEVIRESLRLLHSYEDLRAKRLEQMDQAIDIGLRELKKGEGVSATAVYQRLHKKIVKKMKRN